MMTQKYTVGGMSCSACSAAVDRAVRQVDGVEDVSVSLMANRMTVRYDPEKTNDDTICTAVARAGYSAIVDDGTPRENPDEVRYRDLCRRLWKSVVFALVMMYVTMGHMIGLPLPPIIDPNAGALTPLWNGLLQLCLAFPVMWINRSYYRDGLRGAIHGSANMNTLIALGSGTSFLYGIYVLVKMALGAAGGATIMHLSHELHFESVTMILALITVGRTLELRARRRTSDAVRKLLDLAPKTAEVRRGNEIVTIPADTLVSGDIVLIRAGGGIPCDGVILTGGGASDESVITGESVPVEKNAGDTLICGTILVTGYAEMRAESVGEETTVAKIAAMVEEAATSKAPVQKLADKISRIFVPVVCSIALVTFILWWGLSGNLDTAVSFGISVLVISCPCALGLASPTAIMCGIGRGAECGILIKSADAIDALNKANVVTLDKTGTITEGRMELTEIYPVGEMPKDVLAAYGAALESASEHPIGRAIVSAYTGEIPECTDYDVTFGGGVSGVIDGRRYFCGNASYLASVGIGGIEDTIREIADDLARRGLTPVYFAREQVKFACERDEGACERIEGVFAIGDRIKATSPAAVQSMRTAGCEVVMLTGDNPVTAEAIAKEAGITRVVAQVKPEGKAAVVESLMDGSYFGDTVRRTVVMVGDGVNDAPALAKADCGIAIGQGTDIAIASAGVVLVRSDLGDAARAIRLSRAIMRNVAENLLWAFLYNLICIPIAAGLLYPLFQLKLTPMIAAAAMSLSSVCVVLNALRLRRWRG